MKITSWILSLAVLAFLARAALALTGGQFHFGDEERYLRGPKTYAAMREGRWEDARWFFSQPDHQAFTWLTMAMAPIQHGCAALTGHGNWQRPENLLASARWGAVCLALASAAMVVAVFQLARAAGSTDVAAGWAALLVAASNTLFFTTRHLLPYDTALLLWLLALLASCRATPRRAILAGAATALTFYLYNGYWFLVPLAALWHGWQNPAWRLRAWWVAGATMVAAFAGIVGFLSGGIYYWRYLIFFSNTVKQGLFAEGWSLPWIYLWHSEGPAGAALVILSLALLLVHRKGLPRHVGAALAGLTLAYGLLVLGSVGFEKFVVYGRSTRPLLPLAALVGGWAIATLLGDRPARVHRAAVVLTLLAAGCAQARHYGRIYPREIEAAVVAEHGYPKRAGSFAGIMFPLERPPVTRPDLVLVNALGLYPLREAIDVPRGKILARWPHPLAYLPYQYEGHTPRERALLRSHDISIRLIALTDPAATPDVPPAAHLFSADLLGNGYDQGRR